MSEPDRDELERLEYDPLFEYVLHGVRLTFYDLKGNEATHDAVMDEGEHLWWELSQEQRDWINQHARSNHIVPGLGRPGVETDAIARLCLCMALARKRSDERGDFD